MLSPSSDFSRTLLVVSLALAVLILVTSLAFFEFTLTGRAAGDFVIDKITAGDTIKGTFLYRPNEAGVLPIDSDVVLSVNTLTKRMPLRDVLLEPSIAETLEEVEFSPYLEVTLALSDTPPVSSGESSRVSATVSGVAPAGGITLPDDPPPNAPAPSIDSAVISEVITGERVFRVRAGKDIEATLPAEKFGRIESVLLRGEKTDKSFVSLTQSGVTVRISSLYTEKVKGFSGKDNSVAIDLSKFSFTTPRKWADLYISFIYLTESFATSERYIAVESVTETGPDKEPLGPDGTVLEDADGLPSADSELECGVKIVCGPYSSCTSLSFDGLVALEDEIPQVVQSRTCYDEVCERTFTDTKICVMPSPPLDVVAFNDDDSDITPDETLVQETPPSDDSARISARRDTRTRATYDYLEQDLSLYGSVTRELKENAEILVRVQGEEHAVSVLRVSKNSVRVRVASSPQESDMIAGETRVFDLDGDRAYDISVSVIRIESSSAVVSVTPYDGTSDNPLAPGEKGVSLVNAQLSAPVAQVILNENIPTLRVLLMQSAKRYPLHCYNMVKDINEAGADCGGPDCHDCREEEKDRGALIWWIAFLVSGLMMSGMWFKPRPLGRSIPEHPKVHTMNSRTF